MADPVPCVVCGKRFVPSVGRLWCSVGCEGAAVCGDSPEAAALAKARAEGEAEGEAEGFRRGVAACVADVEGCLDFAVKAVEGPHNSERLRVQRHVRAVVLGQVAYGLRHLGGMGPRTEPEQG